MTKTRRPKQIKRRTVVASPAPRRPVTRREYAELVVRLGSVELQAQRNRAAIDVYARQIVRLQEQVSALRSAASGLPPDTVTPGAAIVSNTPVVES